MVREQKRNLNRREVESAESGAGLFAVSPDLSKHRRGQNGAGDPWTETSAQRRRGNRAAAGADQKTPTAGKTFVEIGDHRGDIGEVIAARRNSSVIPQPPC